MKSIYSFNKIKAVRYNLNIYMVIKVEADYKKESFLTSSSKEKNRFMTIKITWWKSVIFTCVLDVNDSLVKRIAH